MRINNSEAFFHPVTHQLIEANGFYEGAAHLENEDEEKIIVDEVTVNEVKEELKDEEKNKLDEKEKK